MEYKLKIKNQFQRTFVFFLIIMSFTFTVKAQSKIISLEEAINSALLSNNQVKSSQYALEKAKWDRYQAWAQMIPTVDFNTRYTWIDDRTFAERDFRRYFPEEMQKEIPQTVFQETYGSSIDVSANLFNGVLMNGISIANANLDVNKYMNTSTKQNIIFQVIRTYLDVVKNKEMVSLQKEYLELSKLNYEKAERMFTANRYSETEALRWKVEFEQQKNSVVQYENLLRGSLIQLSKLININVNPNNLNVTIPTNLMNDIQNLINMEEDELIKFIDLPAEKLSEVNSQLAAIKAGTEVSRLLYKNNYSSYLPVITAHYSHSWRENNTIALDDYSPKTFMINLKVPIFSGFQNYTKLKSSYYEYKKSEEDYNDQILGIKYLLTDAVNRILSFKMQKTLSESSLLLSEKNYSMIETQKEKGLVSNIEFIDAKLNLQNSKLNKVIVTYDLTSTAVELLYMLGKIETIMN